VPLEGFYTEVFNTDAERYGGSNLGNLGGKFTDPWAIHGYENSLDLCLPPLAVLVFSRDELRSQELLCDEAPEAALPEA
jgi:1,4-alpha-glucan branching enzyme